MDNYRLTERTPTVSDVSLIADVGVSHFYERFGFEVRGPKGPGMGLLIRHNG